MEITESILKNIIKESINELMAYHGSSANFDKFDHKHFLSTGAGSQAFGWGTYVTDDPAIAKSYANINSADNDNTKEYPLILGTKEIRNFDELLPYIKYRINYYGGKWNTEDTGIVRRIASEIWNRLRDYNIDKCIEMSFRYSKAAEDGFFANYNKTVASILSYLKKIGIRQPKFEMAPKGQFVYEVQIPDDNGSNYIDWYGHFPPEFMRRVLDCLKRLKPNTLKNIAEHNYPFSLNMYGYLTSPDYDKIANIICNEDEYHSFFDNMFGNNSNAMSGIGSSVYRQLIKWFGSPKAASLFLQQCGFVGIKYESGTMWKKPEGAKENGYNYVLFNSNNVKIINKKEVQ